MSKLSAEQRRALPLEDFGDPERRLFPIVDQADVDSAARLIGKARNPDAVKARILAICRRKHLQPPAAWVESGATMAATFALESAGRYVDGPWAVYPNALLFRAGDYPDKAFTLSPEEMWLAVEQFTPITGNVLHTDFLKGRACQVRSIRLDDADSEILRGEVAVPVGLDDLLLPEERRLSCEWARGDFPTLSGIALLMNPRVSDAALMSAYAAFAGARHNAGDQRALNAAHEAIVTAGADCPGAHMKEARMSFTDKVRAWFNAGMPADFTGEDVPESAPPGPVPDPRVAELERQTQEQAAQLAAFAAHAAEARQRDATAFADGLVTDQIIPPAKRPQALALFTALLADDAAGQVVTFSDATGAEQQESRVALFRALLSEMRPTDRTAEHIPAGSRALPNTPPAPLAQRTPGAPLTPEQQAELKQLLALTPLGQAVLDGKEK